MSINRERLRLLIAAIPIVGVNATAFIGQFSFMREHITTWPLAGIVLLAATLESIAVYLGYEAHEALRNGDSSFALRMASYAFGAVIAALNYSHYALPGFKPTFLAVATGLMSISSAPLWAIYSRRVGRTVLKASGLVESRSVKFSRVRWLLWPKETFGAFRLSAWNGEQSPDIAVRNWETAQDVKREIAEAEQSVMTLETASTQADAIRIALAHLGDGTSHGDVVRYLADARPRPWKVSPARVRQVRADMARAVAKPAALRAVPGGTGTGSV